MLGFGVSRLTPTYMETIFEIGSNELPNAEAQRKYRDISTREYSAFLRVSALKTHKNKVFLS
jgi:hypothetical protein